MTKRLRVPLAVIAFGPGDNRVFVTAGVMYLAAVLHAETEHRPEYGRYHEVIVDDSALFVDGVRLGRLSDIAFDSGRRVIHAPQGDYIPTWGTVNGEVPFAVEYL
jgi:hypothetical protein